MRLIPKHLQVEMGQHQAVQQEGANSARSPAPNIQEGSKVRPDA
jgi:hypothetical protein